MAKTTKWVLAVFLGSLVWGTLCLAQPPDQVELVSLEKNQGVWLSLEKLSDRDLQQHTGQGLAPPQGQVDQPLAGIKLWDEWNRSQAPELPASGGQNQVILNGP